MNSFCWSYSCYFSWLLLINFGVSVCVCVCYFNYEFFETSPVESFWGLDRRRVLQGGICLLPSRLSWLCQLRDHSKYSAWVFFLFNTTYVMWILLEKPACDYEFTEEVFFSSVWLSLSLGQVYFWFTIMLAGTGIWRSRFILLSV